MKAKHSILIADPIHEDGKQLLADRSSIRFDVATGLDDEGLAARIAGYDALIVRSKISARLLRLWIPARRSRWARGVHIITCRLN